MLRLLFPCLIVLTANAFAASSAPALSLGVETLIQAGGPEGDAIELANRSSRGVRISSVVIDFQSSRGELIVDAGADGLGSGEWRDVVVTHAGDTGFTGITGNVGDKSLDGASQIILDFSEFDAGETFRLTLDLDPLDPRKGAAVDGGLLADTMVTVYFEGEDFGFVRLFGSYAEIGADAAGTTLCDERPDAPTVPEPATFGLVGLGMAGVGWFRRKKLRR
ncbi:MAG: PEP-CTERM motif protein [candidate division BRC1 bacterium ADurb.BinA292]|nr:MAG: PEP-CTERM motif protein [candidate division BRC1 bacterium ADurb.BinA292]